MESLASNVSGGVIEDCGHYVMEEQPDVLAHRLLEFIKHVEGNPGTRRNVTFTISNSKD